MAKSGGANTQYLELHRGRWRVTLSVPRHLQAKLGTKIKRALGTDSLTVANARKFGVLQELKDIIARSEGKSMADRKLVLREADRLRAQSAALGQSPDEVREGLSDQYYQILGKPTGYEVVLHEGEEIPIDIYPPERRLLANQFKNVALGTSVPFDLHLDSYRATKLRVKRRTENDLVRAIERLREWCVSQSIEENIHAVGTRVAREFIASLSEQRELQPRTVKKYLTRLSLYWKWLVYKFYATENPWLQVEVDVEDTPAEEQERAFTNTEVVKLLTGPASQAMRDVMMIGALSGARLDAIVDLRVCDTDRGFFVFKPQKKEKLPRQVPIHSALREIVERRRRDRNPDDAFFPEYPPNAQDSLRERSFKTSNYFTTYRRKMGVDQRVPGRRRSLVNFHSFRRWFTSRAEQAGVDANLLSAMVGHKRGSITLDLYSEGPEAKKARLAIELVKLPPLDGSPIAEPETLLIGKGSGAKPFNAS